MNPEQIVKALEEAVQQLGLEVRWEQGRFRGGRCTINGTDLVILNKRLPAELHLVILADCLRGLPVDAIFLRPAVREAMEAAWNRHPETLRDTLLEPEEDDVD